MLRFIPALVVLAITVAACTSTSAPNSPGHTDTDDKNSFVLNGDGYSSAPCKGFSADSANAASEQGGEGNIVFSGRISNSDVVFTIIMGVSSTVPGSYDISTGGLGSRVTLFVNDGSAEKIYSGLPGTGAVIITEWGPTRVKGTFECGLFLGGSTATATSGKFDAILAP